jgi:hypothetical protein
MIIRTDDETESEGYTFYYQVIWTDNGNGSVRQLWETFKLDKKTVVMVCIKEIG